MLVLVLALLIGVGGSDAFAQAPNGNCPDDPTRQTHYPALWADLPDPRPDRKQRVGRPAPTTATSSTGDLTGDKIDELVVRGIGGIQVLPIRPLRSGIVDPAEGQPTDPPGQPKGWGRSRSYTTRSGSATSTATAKAELIARSVQAGSSSSSSRRVPFYGTAGFPIQVGLGRADGQHGQERRATTVSRGGGKGCWGETNPGYYSTIQLAPHRPAKRDGRPQPDDAADSGAAATGSSSTNGTGTGGTRSRPLPRWGTRTPSGATTRRTTARSFP